MNIANNDNSCMMNEFDGGDIQVKFRVQDGKLSIEYSTDLGEQFKTCI